MSGTTAMFGTRVVPTATATTWVHSSRYLAEVCRANRAEARAAECEREAAGADALSRELFDQLSAAENEIEGLRQQLDLARFNGLRAGSSS